MKIQDQVITVEQAKRLKELGVEHSVLHHFNGSVTNEAWGDNYYPAFTVAELGVMLPATIRWGGSEYTLHCGKSKDGIFECGYIMIGSPLNAEFLLIRNAEKEAQSKAPVLIHLLENKFITPEQCNAALSQP